MTNNALECRDVSPKEVCNFLSEHDRFLLLAHAQPDGDTVGSCFALAYALKKLGKKVKIDCSDKIPAKYSYFTAAFKNGNFKEETVIALDVADQKLFGLLNEKYGNCVDLCIDHHISNKRYAKRLFLNAAASANCENVYEIIKELGVPFTRHITAALYTGIVTDTGCFKYTNVTAKTHRIAAELIDLGVDHGEINRIMFDTKSKARIKIEGAVMEKMHFFFGGRVAFVAITKDMLSSSGCCEDDLDGVNTLARTVEGVMIGVTARQKDGGIFKVSLRTNEPIDASVICGNFGGGGHPRAAGCEINGDETEVENALLPVLKAVLEESGCLI